MWTDTPTMAKIEPFEKYTSRYEDWFENNEYAYRSELQAVKELLPESQNGLEIGVGSGRFAAPLSVKFGVEPSGKMAEIAQRRGINVIGGVAEALPFADSVFDLVLMVTTICFLYDIEIAFREANRVLKADGLFVIGFVDQDSPIGKQYERYKEENVFYRVATFYTVDEVVSHLKEAGFHDFKFIQTIFHSLSEIKSIEQAKAGYGEGSFVVIRAKI